MITAEAIMEEAAELAYARRMIGLKTENPHEALSDWRKNAYATGIAVGMQKADQEIQAAMRRAGIVVVIERVQDELQFTLRVLGDDRPKIVLPH